MLAPLVLTVCAYTFNRSYVQNARASVQVTPPLSLSLLADETALCLSFKEKAQPKNSTKHGNHSCTLYKHITVWQKKLDVTLTRLERESLQQRGSDTAE